MKVIRHILLAVTATCITMYSCSASEAPAAPEKEKEEEEKGPEPKPEPEPEPTKTVKVGILGDSISTFKGWLTTEDYNPFYPDYDPNVGSDAAKAVDSVEKTWWHRLIYVYMKDAVLDVNSSWQGTRVVHEEQKGVVSKELQPAGFIDRCLDFKEPDVIFIHGGTNDKTQQTPLDEYTAAYKEIINKMQAKYSGVTVILIIGDRLNAPYASPILDIAKEYGLRTVDFRGDDIEKCKGSHPTAPAFDFMAKKIAMECADIIPTVFEVHKTSGSTEQTSKDNEQQF